MNNFIYQTNKNDCGFACLKMLLSITYRSSDYLYIPGLEIDNQQYTLLDLKNVALKYGADLESIKYESFDEINIDKPFIYIKTNENGNKHAILVKKKYKKFSIIYDPDYGKKMVKNEDYFNENEHIITYIKSFNKVNFTCKELIEKTNLLILKLLEIISLILIFVGMLMVNQSNEKRKLIFSAAFIVLGLIITLLQRIYIYKMMENYDDSFIRYTYDDNLEKQKNNFKLMNKTKVFLFTQDSKILMNLIFVVFINISLIINNQKFIYISILVLVLITINICYFYPKEKEKKEEITSQEKNILNNKKSIEEYTSCFQDLKNNTYKYAKFIDISKLINYSLIFVLSFVLFIFSSEHLISTLILYFFSGVLSYNYFNESIITYENSKENIINKTLFLTLINKIDINNKQLE